MLKNNLINKNDYNVIKKAIEKINMYFIVKNNRVREIITRVIFNNFLFKKMPPYNYMVKFT
ncbi:hypothetical protein CTM_14793 [Clostridium tetanomorphum DSM 665]|nr:hypothetical protein CTM_14793 [Clostridium tetanomorphum DSM 665]